MRILILTTWFPPDTAVAAIRPYMLAKYLSKFGHEVTVLRSGALNKKPDDTYSYTDLNINVISYLGKDSPAELFFNGKTILPSYTKEKKSRIAFMPLKIRLKIAKSYHWLFHFVDSAKYIKECMSRYGSLKKELCRMQNERFDIIFSTYGELENILGGVFAKKLFSCKFILDFRDGIDLPLRPIYERWMWKIIEKRALNTADAYTAISKG